MRLLIAASIVLVTVACGRSEEFDRRLISPDENYVSEVAREMDAAGISFRAPRDGSLAYRSRDEQAVRAIEEKVKAAAAKK